MVDALPFKRSYWKMTKRGPERRGMSADLSNQNPRIVLKVRYSGCDDLPTLRYKWLLIDSCNSDRYFTDSFNHGVVFYTTTLECLASDSMKRFVQAVIEGKTPAQLETDLDAMETLLDPEANFEYVEH